MTLEEMQKYNNASNIKNNESVEEEKIDTYDIKTHTSSYTVDTSSSNSSRGGGSFHSSSGSSGGGHTSGGRRHG